MDVGQKPSGHSDKGHKKAKTVNLESHEKNEKFQKVKEQTKFEHFWSIILVFFQDIFLKICLKSFRCDQARVSQSIC